ncbi:MAG: hypothetical protein MRK01_15915 [Candidatus Scalindua sp.]|nr:hypothetical protein [Candidatus Scalindua sp.]
MDNLKIETIRLDLLSSAIKGKVNFVSNGFKRVEQHINDSCSQLIDVHSQHGVRIHYLRTTTEDAPKKMNIFLAEKINDVIESNESGILLKVSNEKSQYTVWLPSTAGIFSFDNHQRIGTSSKTHISYSGEPYPHIEIGFLQNSKIGEIAVVSFISMEDRNGKLFDELNSLTDVELRLYLKSNWFFAKAPIDVWNYLINGSLYDPRYNKYNHRSHRGANKRHKCQQCAYSWWNYLKYLHRETDKRIYDIIQDEIAYSVLLDMSAEGKWKHGFWYDDMETHARFQLDGIHLLISQYEKSDDPMWLEAAQRGMTFVAEHLMEQLDDGSLWFLHDTVEQKHPHRLESTIFGKTSGNSLCINTHVQALTVLHRLRSVIPEKKIYDEMFEKGKNALYRLLNLQPGDIIYRPLVSLLMKYKSRKRPVSILGRLWNRLEWEIIGTLYDVVRRYTPRIAQPGGFIDRDLTASSFDDTYHVINIKDFLTLYRQEQIIWLRPYIINGVEFTRKLLEKKIKTDDKLHHYYIEYIDILFLYDKLVNQVSSDEIASAEGKMYQQTGGYSLDYYASELVRGH